MYAAIGRHPNEATGFDDADLAELRGARRAPALRGDRRDRPRLLPRLRARAPTRSARSRRRSSSRATTGKPLVIHTRAAEDDTLATLARARATGLRGDPALLLDARAASRSASADGWWISFAGNVTYPKADDLRAAAERVPADRLLVETDAPYLTPQAVRKAAATSPRTSSTPRASSPSAAASPTRSSRRAVERNAAALFGW